jgi:hypothetical protein
MVLAAIAATFAQLLDLGTFVGMVMQHGSAAEANPLVAALLTNHGLPLVAAAKLAALSLIVGIIAVLARSDGQTSHPRLAFGVALLAVVAGVVGGLSNVAVIV